MSVADKDGIAPVDSAALVPVLYPPSQAPTLDERSLAIRRREIVELIRRAEAGGLLALYSDGGSHWCWLPHVASYLPTRGADSRKRDTSRPAPPRDAVTGALFRLWGRQPEQSEARSACPRAWGRTRAAAGSAVAATDVTAVWAAWRDRQQRPAACRLGAGAKRQIESAVLESPPEHLIALIRYAYEADEPGPLFWRGGPNGRGRTYLGLDNLLRVGKLAGRVQSALAWSAAAVESSRSGDGNDLGPMAAYRRRGTTSTPNPRPARLSRQCRQMLRLFIARGDRGVYTSELAAIALKYTGRVSELRGIGADVYVATRDPDGNNLYRLRNPNDFADGCPSCRRTGDRAGCLVCRER